MTLKEKASTFLPKRVNDRRYTEEEEDLALAWMADEITLGQVAYALFDQEKDTTRTKPFLLNVLSQAFLSGRLQIK